jgi:hypothetical protein
MTDAMFTFAWHALAEGFATRTPAGKRIVQARGRFAALSALSHRRREIRRLRRAGRDFWSAFAAAIGLPDALKDDSKNPEATAMRSPGSLPARPRRNGRRPILAGADCCATIVASLEEACAIRISSGAACSARKYRRRRVQPSRLAVPIAPEFRAAGPKPSCRLDGD